MSDISSKQFIERILLELDLAGWCRSQSQDPRGKVCLLGAIGRAMEYFERQQNDYYDWDVAVDARRIIEAAIRDATPSSRRGAGEPIVDYNDVVATSIQDIQLVLRQAIARCEARDNAVTSTHFAGTHA